MHVGDAGGQSTYTTVGNPVPWTVSGSANSFYHDLSHFDWKKIEFIPDSEIAWTLFWEGLMKIVNTHAPLMRCRVKG